MWKKGTALVPSLTAFAVVGLLEQYFADLVDYGFTASMEDDLDEIAGGEEEYPPWLGRFYFGTAAGRGRRRRRTATAADAGTARGLGLKGEVALTSATSTPARSTRSPSGRPTTARRSWPGSGSTAPI